MLINKFIRKLNKLSMIVTCSFSMLSISVYAAYPEDCWQKDPQTNKRMHGRNLVPRGFLEQAGDIKYERESNLPTGKWVFHSRSGEVFEISENFGMLDKPNNIDFEDIRDILLSQTPSGFIVTAHVNLSTGKVVCLTQAEMNTTDL